MNTSTALASPPPLPLGSSSRHDPDLKPNPHPYAIKTTHTALLSRSNSSGHTTPSKYLYTPSTGTLSCSPKMHAHEYRGHRYSTSLSGELPFPIPSPLPSPTHPQGSESEGDSVPRRPRADTLPTYLTDNDEVLTTEPEPNEALPLNPKTWTPSQLSVYLTRALRVRSGERLPERVAHDITSWVRREGVGGRAFLRWTDDNLKDLGINMLWRSALLAAARNLRQNILRGRIWGNPASDLGPEQEQEQGLGQDDAPFSSTLYASSSSSLDLPLADGDTEVDSEQRLARRLRVSKKANGWVRGMVDKWERESVESHSPARSSGRSSRCGSESDNGSEHGDGEIAAAEDVDASRAPGMLVPLIPVHDTGAVPTADDEPSIEELLATGSASSPMNGSWGARAWEEVDAGTTMRRLEQHGTVVPHRDAASGRHDTGLDHAAIFATHSKPGGLTNSSRRVRGASGDDPQPSRRSATDIFAEPPGTVSSSATLVEVGVQADTRAEIATVDKDEDKAVAVEVEAKLKAKELALESEARDMRTLLDEFRRRLEEVEARVSAMEADRHPVEEEQADILHWQPEAQAQEDGPVVVMAKDTPDKAIDAIPIEAGMTPERNAIVVAEDSPCNEKGAGRDDSVVAETRNGPERTNPETAQDGPVDRVVCHVDRVFRQVDAVRHVDGAIRHVDGVVRHVVDLPTTVAELPSYVLLVGLGVCTVVLQVMLKGVGSRTLKS